MRINTTAQKLFPRSSILYMSRNIAPMATLYWNESCVVANKRKVNRNVNLKPEDAHCFLPLPLINLCLLWFSPLSFKHHLAVPLVQFLSLPVHPSQMLWSDYIPPQLKNIQWLPTTNRTMTFSTWFQPNFPILFTSIFVNFIFQQASIEKLSYARAILSGV